MCIVNALLCSEAADLTSCLHRCCGVCGQMPEMATGPCEASVSVLIKLDCGQSNHKECKSRGSAIILYLNTFNDSLMIKYFLHLTKISVKVAIFCFHASD